MNADPKPSRRFAEYVRKIACDEWEVIGTTGQDKAVMRHSTGATVAYALHDGGNDWNGPRNFALEVQRICGCRLIEPRGRKASRKSTRIQESPEVLASRRRHAETWEAKRRARDETAAAEKARQEQIKAIQAAERRRREIEELMR